MHIPDSFIPPDQALIYWALALPFIIMSVKWAKNELDEMKVPILAALAAGIFAILGRSACTDTGAASSGFCLC